MAIFLIGGMATPFITNATGNCAVTSAVFTTGPNFSDHAGFMDTQTTPWYSLANIGNNTDKVGITINTTNCSGDTLKVSITSIGVSTGLDQDIGSDTGVPATITTSTHMPSHLPITVDNTETITIHLRPGETLCNGSLAGINNDCSYYITVYKPGDANLGNDVEIYRSFTPLSPNLHPQSKLLYDCSGECSDPWSLIEYTPRNTAILACKVLSAEFDPYGFQGGTTQWYYNGEGKSPVTVTVKTSGCTGVQLQIAVAEHWTVGLNDVTQVAKMENLKYVVDGTGTITANLWPGETNCHRVGGSGFDCQYYLKVYGIPDGTTYNTFNPIQPRGNLQYMCDGITCTGDDWGVEPSGTEQHVNTITDYYPLAPLPGIGETCSPDPSDPSKTNCVKTAPDPTTGCSGFASYLNALIKVFIGISAVLAMIMIIMGGIEYMTTEAISGKESGKERITNSIFGLLLALGAYMLLNTINPQLLNIGLCGIPDAQVSISPTDTSNGSNNSLCISNTNPPNPDSATGTNITLNPTMVSKYIPARDPLNIPVGIKLLITAQTYTEGFSDVPPPPGGTKSYRTNNPGNIGNTDDGTTKTYPTLADGIKAQRDIVTNVANGTSTSYKIGSKPTCALGSESYNGSLYQYLRIYSTGARMNNNYLNSIIGYFAQNQKTITGRTKMSEIAALN